MKHIYRTVLSLIGAVAISSCSGFLDENPTSSLSEVTAYSTEETLEAEIYGCYLSMHATGLWKGYMAEYFHTASGLLIWKGKRTTDDVLDGLKFAKYSTSAYGNKSIWDNIYTGVNRCNRLLDNLPGSPVADSYKKEIEAEARFVRAILYYTAVRIWGDVPLLLSSPTSVSQINNPRVHFARVYKQVLDDLTFAETFMRDKARAEEIAPGTGRPNKWAATSFKSSVYLTIGSLLSAPDDNFWDTAKPERIPDFSPCGIQTADDAFILARAAAESVIASGVYSLVPDFRQLFRWTEPQDWFLPERIVCLESTDKVSPNYNSTRMLPEYPEGTANFVTENTNNGRVRPSRFLIDNFIRVGGGQLGTAASTADIYVTTTDPRFNASFITSNKNQKTGATLTTYPNSNRIETYNNANCLPYFRKYLDPTYDVTSGKADFYLMRYAEIYLISAEASASLSKAVGDSSWQAAIGRVNDIRRRARMSVDEGQTPATMPRDLVDTDCATPQDLVNMVMWERVCELCAEGHEWFDTHRRGARWLRDNIAVPANHFYADNTYQHTYWNYVFEGADARGYTYVEDEQDLRKSLLAALPEAEIRINSKISNQNDFYWQ